MVIDWLAWYRRSPSTDDLSKELSPSEKKSKGGVAFIQRQVLKDLDLGDIEGKNEVGFCSVEAVAVTSSTVAISEVSDPDSSKNKGSVLKSRDVSVLGNTVLKSYSSSVSKEGFEASQAESEADEEEDEEVRISRSKRKEESDLNPESEKVPVLEDKIIKIEVVDHCEGKGEVLEVGDTASATLPEGASCQVSTKGFDAMTNSPEEGVEALAKRQGKVSGHANAASTDVQRPKSCWCCHCWKVLIHDAICRVSCWNLLILMASDGYGAFAISALFLSCLEVPVHLCHMLLYHLAASISDGALCCYCCVPPWSSAL
ncbi:hypothetical protein U1Q18_040603 [Sarracenia purpurea var. burkii]